MHRHPIDPLSAVLGLAATIAGVVVAIGRAEPLTDDAVWWIALLALLLGVALVPWNRRPAATVPIAPRATDPADHGPDEQPATAQRFDVLQLPPADSDR